MSNATEELRRLLDERGVEWRDESNKNVLHTTWNGMNCWFIEQPDGSAGWGMSMCGSPEQAVAATLGKGTCKLPETRIDHGSIEHNGTTEWRRCSACGTEVLAYPAHFCPNCGREVSL